MNREKTKEKTFKNKGRQYNLLVRIPFEIERDIRKVFDKDSHHYTKSIGMVNYLLYLQRLNGLYGVEYDVPRGVWETIATGKYNQTLNKLVEAGIILRNDYHWYYTKAQKRKDKSLKGQCKSFAINSKYYKQRDGLNVNYVNVSINRKTYGEHEKQFMVDKYAKDDIKNLVIPKGIKIRIGAYVDSINKDSFQVNEQIDGFNSNKTFIIKVLNGNKISKFRSSLHSAYKKNNLGAKNNNRKLIKDGKDIYLADIDQYVSNKKQYVWDSYNDSLMRIKKRIIYAKRNKLNGRVDTNITNMPNLIMKEIMEENDLVEIDLKNSQYAFLASELEKAGINTEDSREFCEHAYQGTIYEEVMETLGSPNRNQTKLSMMLVNFSSHRFHSEEKRRFKERFPSVVEFTDKMKREKGKKSVSVMLQRAESDMFIDKLWEPLKEMGFFCMTKHDSLIVKKKDYPIIVKFVQQVFKREGFRGAIDINKEIIEKSPLPIEIF